MWNMFFALNLCGVFITATTESDLVWFIIFKIAMYICVFGEVFTHEKQKEKIKNLEKKIEKLEELVGEDK